ncbi:MAG: hypothetical protein IPG74_04375 [Flavobacteriales bacterium]|nr:hypothetical protein [Flavobacteriales bacterium]
MSFAFNNKVRKLRKLITRYDATSNAGKLAALQDLSAIGLASSPSLVGYADLLQFVQAFPPERKTLRAAEKELARIRRFLARPQNRSSKSLINSGLPHTPYVSKFSHDLCNWLAHDPACRMQVERFEDPEFDLNKVLAITLPSLERSETTSGFGNQELLDTLKVPRERELQFLLAELQKLDHSPRIKDLLFDGLGLYVRILPKNKSFSRIFNRIPTKSPFFHDGILKAFDHRLLMEQPLCAPVALDRPSREIVIRAVKLSMVLTDRETDPTTYLDEHTFRLYDLERGISVAIYGMVPSRQLPMESYIGYTLFKNGFPAAYGGGWVFGRRADFGINIFEAFRGGESGYMLCQLLRVFRQVFGVAHFEIEPYQFGLDNPDGIATGAFWFYHRYGFRPKDKALLLLSEQEVAKRKARKNHRTSNRVLLRFTKSNMALMLSGEHQPGVYDITALVKRMIRVSYKGDRARAENESVKKFQARTGCAVVPDTFGAQVLKEVALWAEATKQSDPEKLDLLVRMIGTKPGDPYQYQELLLQYFRKS